MFFSGAITAILPYLLFLGVVSTFFYGISEKLALLTGNQPDNCLVTQGCETAESLTFKKTCSFTDYQNGLKENSLSQKTCFQKDITNTDPFKQPAILASLNRQQTDESLKELVNTSLTFRGPPVLG